MSGNENAKRKLLELAKLLYRQTDEEHRLSMEQIISHLEGMDIAAERKSIYRDIQELTDAGMDICRQRGYFVASREFELAELKLLADAVASSGSVSQKRSLGLIKKLQGLASVHQARQLKRSVYVSGRAKSENDSVLYVVDSLHQAINQRKQISFVYYEYTADKTLKPRRNGQRYQVSPYLMCWDNQHYYLVAYHERYGELSHFRVDKMKDIIILDKQVHPYDGNIDGYAASTFGMFAGKQQRVEIEIPADKIGVVIDRFGKDIFTYPSDDGKIRVSVNVALSPVFYSWVFMLGDSSVVYPPDARKQYRQMLLKAVSLNGEEEQC